MFGIKDILCQIESKMEIEQPSNSLLHIESKINSVINLNIFPELGAKKELTATQRQTKVAEYISSLEEINKISTETEKNVVGSKDSSIVVSNSDSNDLESLEASLAQFQMHSLLLCEKGNNFPKGNTSLNYNRDNLKKASENMDTCFQVNKHFDVNIFRFIMYNLFQLLQDTKAIIEFPEHNDKLILKKESNNFSEIYEATTTTADLLTYIRKSD